MISMSLTNYRDFLSKTPPVPDRDAQEQLVRKVGANISAAVVKYMNSHGQKDRVNGYNWEFNLVKNSEVNAWCMPGGKVVVYTGLLPVTQNETALACVMGHEIAHAVARHGNERLSQLLIVELGGIGLDLALSQQSQKTRQLADMAFGVSTTVGVLLPYSRMHESEADKLGIVFMAMAGYDPHEAITFWERMAKQNKSSMPAFLSTHPSDEQRVKDLKDFLPTAMGFYTKH